MFVKRRRKKEEDCEGCAQWVWKRRQGREGIIQTTDTREGSIPHSLILVL